MTNPLPEQDLRASDAEREQVATRLRAAATDGLLTMPEADERLAAAYAAVTRGELAALTTDLPSPTPAPVDTAEAPLSRAARRRLTIHAVIVAVMAVNLLVRFVLSGVPFFWPAFPLTLLLGTLAIHYAIARRGYRRPVRGAG